jgi:hypothetical protein
VAEELALDQGRRHRAAVDRQKRLVAARAVRVNRAGHFLLPGTGLARDEDGGLDGGGTTHERFEIPRGRRVAEEPIPAALAASGSLGEGRWG